MSKFDDIRPYNDSEVREVLDRVLSDGEFKRMLARLSFPVLGKIFPALVAPIVGWYVKRELHDAKSVADVQAVEDGYMAKMMANTVDGLSASGFEKLDKNKAYLFVSNHRDIAMDPGFVQWVMYQHGFDTPRLAIGDNLLTKPFASDLMRLNKSFLVNRSAKGNKEKFKALKHLSEYIYFSIVEEGASIWIAQREGRAKDGVDRTNPAIVKMFTMNKPKEQRFADYLRELHIIPVSISYEWDPCDEAKARERYIIKQDGSYQKGAQEDVMNIAKGIAGTKGHVHVAFGDELIGDFNDADEVAAEIDRQVINNFVLQPSNCIAYRALHGSNPKVAVGQGQIPFEEEQFKQQAHYFAERLRKVQPKYRAFVREMYANPVVSKLADTLTPMADIDESETPTVKTASL
jgi:hypothetical protein